MIKDVISAFKSAYPNRVIEEIAEYKGHYLIAAPQKGLAGGKDFSDGFYLMTKDAKQIRSFLPMEDVIGFQRALLNNPVYKK